MSESSQVGQESDGSCEPVAAVGDAPLSKNQQKKLARRQRMLEKRLAARAGEKERRKANKKRRAELGVVDLEKQRRKSLASANKRFKTEDLGKGRCGVAIDCSFDAEMTEKEISSLAQQCSHLYSANMQSETPVSLHMTSFDGKLREHMTSKFVGFENWKVRCDERRFDAVFAREQIVYLTAESETVLDDLDPDAVYVIGGLVDHNRLKGVCHERATALGLKTAQLPIAEHLQMSSRKVLTVNHVFEILSRYLETKSWTTALQAVIPQRKGAVLKAAPTAIGDLGEKVDGKGEKANDSAANSTPGAPAAGSGLGVDEKRADEKTAAPGAPSD